ncbi:MAG: 1-aminocyclopropane-carboxylate deaminase [Bacteroidetes bacterium]|jgi:1-aminocyclopropane-1-carboxylate deaminase/D-cysteine desulfhydrase-like pyridoxal-dependent ACC family enzyme|nr:1-aminocyclopropane-carboxylate deaminase [Bacteroidota bacterium]
MQGHSFDIPLVQIKDEITENHEVKLYILRTDLNDPFISGNKLFKLKYNLEKAAKENKESILTFGGAFSNHIAATAAAGNKYGFKTIGIIRGEKTEELNPTLKFAQEQGMELYYVSRESYGLKDSPDFLSNLQFSNSQILQFTNSFIIPEGGSNELGIKGCKEITDHIKIPFDVVCCPCGTGTTFSGIILSLKKDQSALGFQVLKGKNYLKGEVESWLKKIDYSDNGNWEMNEDYHCGGYAKRSPELIGFISDFEKKHNIPLDFIYTGKMMYGIYDLIKKKYFKKGQTIVAIHTGGIQGNAGFNH